MYRGRRVGGTIAVDIVEEVLTEVASDVADEEGASESGGVTMRGPLDSDDVVFPVGGRRVPSMDVYCIRRLICLAVLEIQTCNTNRLENKAVNFSARQINESP